jgi:ankyrin repeat protein
MEKESNDEPTQNKIRPLFAAAITNHDNQAVIKLLADFKDQIFENEGDQYYMHQAARKNNPDALAILANQGVSVNVLDDYGDTQYPPLWSASVHKALDAVRWLLANGSIVNQEGECGEVCYALQVAAREGPLELVKMLVEAGANINGVSGDNTPLSFALMYNQPEIAEYLRSLGAREPHEVPGAVPARPEKP